MDSKKMRIVENALRQIAEREGKTIDDIREDIRAALSAGRESPDASVRDRWQSVPCVGDEPTPEEVVLYLAEDALRKAGGQEPAHGGKTR